MVMSVLQVRIDGAMVKVDAVLGPAGRISGIDGYRSGRAWWRIYRPLELEAVGPVVRRLLAAKRLNPDAAKRALSDMQSRLAKAAAEELIESSAIPSGEIQATGN